MKTFIYSMSFILLVNYFGYLALGEQKAETTKPLFKITAYCSCTLCNGKDDAGLVSDGHTMKYYQDKGYNIIAVDPKVIPLHSIVKWNNIEYYAVDVGSAIKGNRIDILLDTHEDTIKFGVKENQEVEIK